MKSATALAAAMLAAVMLAGCVSSATPPGQRTAPERPGASTPMTVAEAKAALEAYRGSWPFPPEYREQPGNVRAEGVRELLAGSVLVSNRVMGTPHPAKRLQIVQTGRDGRVASCQYEIVRGRPAVWRWSWKAGKVRSPDGMLRPVVHWDSRSYGRGRGGPLSVLHDGSTGETVMHFGPGRRSWYWLQWFGGHLQERLPAVTWKLCPDFPSAEELGVGVNQAQTSLFYDELVAQDPGRRIRRPDLVTTDPAEPDPGAGPWLQATRARLVVANGRAILMDPASWGRLPAVVYYEPLSAIWALGTRNLAKASDAEVARSGAAAWHVSRDARDGHVRLDWNDGERDVFAWPQPDPVFTTARARHPLAVKHDRLLAEALESEVAELPAGSRFNADGTVLLPEGGHRGRAPTWKSHGDVVEIVRSGRSGTKVPLDELVAALGR